MRFLLVLSSLALSAGCSLRGAQEAPTTVCEQQLRSLHETAGRRGVADVQSRTLGDYSYLRADRLLWSLLPDLRQKSQRQEWTELSRVLGARALKADHYNLYGTEPGPALMGCLERQAKELAGRNAVLSSWGAAPYPREYLSGYRVLGLYPLSRHLMLSQLTPLQNRLKARYERGRVNPARIYLPSTGKPLAQSQITEWLRDAVAKSALGLPLLSLDRQRQLLNHFAPIWEIETLGHHDFPGIPRWKDKSVVVDALVPTTFSQISFTRWRDRKLLQLSYVIWFDERPPEQALDIYAGRLDGLIVRLTLDHDGKPLLLDSIHPCGCYHKLIPLQRGLELRATETLGEPPLLLRGPERQALPGEHLRLVVSSGDHMLIGVRWVSAPEAGQPYRLEPLDKLRSLASDSGYRSLYSPPYGLINGSERPERWLLWPSGVVSPGAMRQWGRHAIAFGSVRHFDDPYLLGELFVPLQRPGQQPVITSH